MLESHKGMDARGRVTETAYGNGLKTVRSYDPESGRLTAIDTTLGATVIQDNEYAWRTDGLLAQRKNSVDGANLQRETFAYDPLGRLTEAKTFLKGGATASRALSSAYDALGNLTSKTSSVAGDLDVTNYAYGGSACAGGSAPGPNAVRKATIGSVAHTLCYDAHGRVTRYDDGATGDADKFLEWNARHLLTTVTVGDSLDDATPTAKDEFAYGPDGARYHRKSTWAVTATDGTVTYPVEHTFYAGGHKEVVRVNDTVNTSVETSRISESVLHVRSEQ